MTASHSYLKHWNTTKPVFLGQVAPDDMYLPTSFNPLIQRGILFAQQGGGLIVWAGPKGSGRSSLAKFIYQATDLVTTEPMLLTLVQEEVEAGWLMGRLTKLFCPKEKGRSKGTTNSYEDFANSFEEVLGEGRGLALFIDAAENIRSAAALGEIASLLNLQSLASGKLSVTLFGTDQLAELCKRSQAVASRTLCHLAIPPLDPNQVAAYIELRCTLAGIGTSCFEPATFPQIWSMTSGIISRINTLSENSLIEAAALNLDTVSQRAVAAASQFIEAYRPPQAPTAAQNAPPPPGNRTSQSLASLFRTPGPPIPPKKEDG